MDKDFLYKDISYQIRGACFWVWKEFGNAFKESVIDNALTEELRRRGLIVETQKKINIFYKGKKVGTYKPDKIINNCIIIETKCKPFLTNKDLKQFWHYLKGTNYKVGFLINFGEKGLEIKRVVYDMARRQKDLREDLRIGSASRSALRGFSLVEMLVAIAIFSLVIGSVIGMFISAIRSQSKALASQKLLDETSYVMEYMGRALRMAKKELDCTDRNDPSTCSCLTTSGYGYNYEINPAGNEIKFIRYIEDIGDTCQKFYLSASRLKEDRDGVFFGDLTSDDIQITFLQFNLSGEAQPTTDYLQPRVTISMTIQKAGGGPKIQIQTSISQRNLDAQQ